MRNIKLHILYFESKAVYALSIIFYAMANKFMHKHTEIYIKYRKLYEVEQ